MTIQRYAIASLDQLEEGQSLTFRIQHEGEEIEGFLVNFEGDLFAYRNRCVHVPMRLDSGEDNVLFEGGGRRLRCQSHGATFKPDSGECISGPQGCHGEYLHFLALAVDGDQVFVVLKNDDEDPAAVH
jgi:nitrite reductase/ring-hydroxylating ferredoxin subunit